MAETPALTMQDPPPAPGEDDISVRAEQRKLTDDMKNYIDALAESPFTKNIVIDSRHVPLELSRFWPDLPGREAQAAELWQEIEDAVRAIPAMQTSPQILLRVTVDSAPFLPGALSEPHESAVVETFDTAEGVRNLYVVPMSGEAQVSNDMGIASGLMVVCQPLLPLINPLGDNRKLAMKAGNLYTERTRDRLMTSNEAAKEREEEKSISIASEKARPVPESPHPHPYPHPATAAEAVGAAEIAEAVEKREEAHQETRREEKAASAHEAVLAEAMGAAESEVMATERDLAKETVVAENEITETREEKQLVAEKPERPESAEMPENKAAIHEAESAATERAPETESPFAPPHEAVEAAAETKVELKAESKEINFEAKHPEARSPEPARAEAHQEREIAQHAREPASEPAREREQAPEASRESAGETPERRTQEPSAEQERTASTERAPESVVEKNAEAQENIREAREENRRREELHPAHEAPQEEKSSVKETKEKIDEMKERFGETKPREERHERRHGQEAANRSTSSTPRVRNEIHDRIASDYHTRTAPVERPFRHNISAHATTREAVVPNKNLVVRRFVAKGARIAAKAFESANNAFGAMLARARRKPVPMGRRAREDQPQTQRVFRKPAKAAPVKKQAKSKGADQAAPRPSEFKKPTPEI